MQNPHLQSDFPAHALRKRLRKSFVSGSFGFSNSSFGGLSSTITPFAMKITRLETSRANAISWVTMIMVRLSCARSLITSRTSPTIWGSSADVGSSKSRISGSMARALAIATRCFWPPESCFGLALMYGAIPTFSR